MMRVAFAVLALLGWASASAPASAYENFIPLGNNYSPENPSLPPLNSRQDQINAQVDIFESDVYNRARTAREFTSQLDQFSNTQEWKGPNDFIDY